MASALSTRSNTKLHPAPTRPHGASRLSLSQAQHWQLTIGIPLPPYSDFGHKPIQEPFPRKFDGQPAILSSSGGGWNGAATTGIRGGLPEAGWPVGRADSSCRAGHRFPARTKYPARASKNTGMDADHYFVHGCAVHHPRCRRH